MKFFEAIESITKKISGDPQSETYQVRKSFFESLAGILGFIVVNGLYNKIKE